MKLICVWMGRGGDEIGVGGGSGSVCLCVVEE